LKRLIPQQSEKPQRNPDERRRYEEPGEGDGRKNQEETKKNRNIKHCCCKNREQFPSRRLPHQRSNGDKKNAKKKTKAE
jgi:hypothetical protein